MKLAKTVLLAMTVAGIGVASSANAQGFHVESAYPTYFAEMRPMVAKLNAADRRKATDMEAAIMKMEGEHRMAMTKATLEHKMVILKMRREYEDFAFRAGGG